MSQTHHVSIRKQKHEPHNDNLSWPFSSTTPVKSVPGYLCP